MKQFLLLFCLISASCFSKGQQVKVTFSIGDTLELGECPDSLSFKRIDYYKKTRFVKNNLTYNKENGEGFYDYFFKDGDFDVSRLPCKYSGFLAVLISIQPFQDKKTGQVRNVFFCRGPEPNSILWIEIDDAANEGEIFIYQ